MTESKAPSQNDPVPNEVKKMNDYKGGSLPMAIIPLSGTAVGMALPYGIRMAMDLPQRQDADGLVSWLRFAPIFSVVFFGEFLMGAAARSESTKASFSPAAAALSKRIPFSLVESNRIHQNHIESFVTLLPAVAAASLVDSSWAIACTIAWTISRITYRIGYRYKENPFWRIFGVSAALCQFFVCSYIAATPFFP